ncbi:hypothetical protein ACNTMW_11445 [Planosporangium sp. 12N6]|uniref:hypothetical protein n=1 Tax=Planosporangium spinosum TaxID=3402278 RepID=UPI003CF376BC
MILPYDIENPPEEPPDGADRLVWLLAWAVHVEHQPGANGFCVAPTCARQSVLWPCHQSKLATGGFLFAAWHLRKLPP